MYKNKRMLSAAMQKAKPAVPETNKKELPKVKVSYMLPKVDNQLSPSKQVGYTFDNMHFGTSPPNKNFMENLKNRLEKF
tara:strand:+ start:214 stop:450 length:237 start_codon:yes stop_codon:yes gene_type:complete